MHRLDHRASGWVVAAIALAAIGAAATPAEAKGRGRGPSGAGITVVGTGDADTDRDAVQAALDQAAQGATADARTVTLQGSFNFTKPTIAAGPRLANVSVPSHVRVRGDRARFDLGPAVGPPAVFGSVIGFLVFEAEGVSLSSLSLSGGDRAILAFGATDLAIEDCRFEGSISGVFAVNSVGVLIAGNHVVSSARNGISIAGSTAVEVRDNRIEACAQTGVLLDSSASAEVHDNEIAGCASSGVGVQTCLDGGISVYDNRIEDCGQGISAYLSDGVEVCDNRVTACETGLLLEAATGIAVTDNRVTDSLGDGVRIALSDDFRTGALVPSEATLTDNRITGSGGAGVRVIDSAATLDDNAFAGNAGGDVVFE